MPVDVQYTFFILYKYFVYQYKLIVESKTTEQPRNMDLKQQNVSNFRKGVSHPRFLHFLLYCSSYILMGQLFTALGPMFPYMSAKQNRLETQYSILLIFRAFGFVAGTLIIRLLTNKVTFHQIMGAGISVMSLFSILFNSTQNLYLKGVLIFFCSIGSSFLDVTLNLATIECFKGDNLSTWLQILHGAFGVGGLLGPYAVYLFQLRTLTILGILSWFTAVFYYVLQTPQNIATSQEEKLNEINQQRQLPIPEKSIYLIAFAFLCQVGQQTSYGGWISSYSVLKNYSTKQHATFYSSLYWGSITLFRFIFAMVSGSPTQKVKSLGMLAIFATFLSYFIILYIHVEAGLITMSFLYGMSNSVVYPLLLSVHQEQGYKLTINETSIFVMWGALGEGCLAVLVGKFMEWFSYDWLMYSMALINVVLIYIVVYNSRVLIEWKMKMGEQSKLEKLLEKKEYRIGEEIKQKETQKRMIELKQIN